MVVLSQTHWRQVNWKGNLLLNSKHITQIMSVRWIRSHVRTTFKLKVKYCTNSFFHFSTDSYTGWSQESQNALVLSQWILQVKTSQEFYATQVYNCVHHQAQYIASLSNSFQKKPTTGQLDSKIIKLYSQIQTQLISRLNENYDMKQSNLADLVLTGCDIRFPTNW